MQTITEGREAFSIDGTSYAVERRSARVLEITSSKGDTYKVIQGDDRLTCTCPAFTYREAGRARGQCKHIRAMLAGGVIPTTPSEIAVDGVLSLAELVCREADRFAAWDSGAGDLMAGRLRELAAEINATQATTVEDFVARLEAMDPAYPTRTLPPKGGIH